MYNYIFADLARKAEMDGRKVYTFLASTPSVDRQGEILTADGWQLDNYRKNPVVLDSHQYLAGIKAILGHAVDLRDTKSGLEADLVFNNSEMGRLASDLIESGDLRAVSVGFAAKEIRLDPKGKEPLQHIKKELLEISVVAVPANSEALRLRMYQGMLKGVWENPSPPDASGLIDEHGDELMPKPTKAAIPAHTAPMAEAMMAWDAAAEVKKAEGAIQLRKMHAWFDLEGDPDLKASYKLPHHLASGESVWRGVAAAMAALLGARGGVNIPNADRKGVWTHLARHYEQFGKTPPEFKSEGELDVLGPEEIKGLFWEDEFSDLAPTTKRGRILSKATEGKIRQAVDLLREVLTAVEEQPTTDETPDGKAVEVDLDLAALMSFFEKAPIDHPDDKQST